MNSPLSWKQALENVDQSQLELAGVGSFAQVVKVANTGFVVKKQNPHPVVGDLQPIEKKIYERLGHHPFILRYYGEYQGEGFLKGLVFQYLPKGTLSDNLHLSNYPEERTKWPIQAVEALRYIHSKNVIHSDLGSHNFLIQEDGTLALSDFGGSTIDGSTSKVGCATRYQRPCSVAERLMNSTEKDDLFALGAVLYEISIGSRLFADISSREIRRRFSKHEYPDLTAITATNIRVVIGKCWNCEYERAEEALRDLCTPTLTATCSSLYVTGLPLGVAFIILIVMRYRRNITNL